LIATALVARPTFSAVSTPAARARTLYESAMKHVALGTPEERWFALGLLEQAALLDPSRFAYAIAAGRLSLKADELHRARFWGQWVLARDSMNADAHYLLGSVWRRDWLLTPDPTTLQRAIVDLCRAARSDPQKCDTWMTLVPLLVETGELEAAREGAEMAWESDSARAETWLARAYTLQRSGDLEHAAPLFESALARMPEKVRQRFEDISPLLPPGAAEELEQMSPSERATFTQRFWDDNDPDLLTPFNEVRLEFLARAAQAYFLFFDPNTGTWDSRGDLYVRFGQPGWMGRNPPFPLTYLGVPKGTWMVWEYPELGMRVWMAAANALGNYELPTAYGATLPHAYADSILRRPELMAFGGAGAVFARIPPGSHPIPLDCALARFQGDPLRRLLAHAECPGGPGDSLQLEWAVFDSSRQERARSSRWMSASACAPAEARAGSFTADLPSGDYRIGLSVRDQQGGRGTYTGTATMGAPEAGLSLSDVIVTCGQPQASFVSGGDLRLEVNPSRHVRSTDKLTAYFEVYHLSPGADGWSHLEYVYTVRSIEKDRRVWLERVMSPRKLPPPVEASRAEDTPGAMRRQFVTVPIRSLPPGRYEIEIRVRDLNSGARAVGTAQFLRESS
jgi:GWxTD domain-containing protein